MFLSTFLSHINEYKWVNFVGIEDYADKLSFNISTSLLLLFTALVTVKSYVLSPITCYIPILPSGMNFDNFLKDYCWVHGTIPMNSSLMRPGDERAWGKLDKNQRINYYQWVPFVLALQGALFYIPRIIWQILSYNLSGLDLEGLVVMANHASNQSGDVKINIVKQIVNSLENMFHCHRQCNLPTNRLRIKISKLKNRFCGGKRSGKQMIYQYMFIKLLFVLNVFGQLFLMQRFLQFDRNESYFGYKVLKDLLDGREWTETQIFPRVTFCYVNKIQHVGMDNDYLAQCVLPVNMLNEKVYIFLWFWMVTVAAFTVLSVAQWIFRLSFPNFDIEFLTKFLRVREMYHEDSFRFKMFSDKFLRKDGVFIIRMMSMNAGDVVTGDIVTQLWASYKDKYPCKDNSENMACLRDFV